ncbi:uncharacterized protein LOC100367977 [Saccoglossus kowalevskii]|uniref:Uncharacterized protein LOC100367977 n=1 Tax=Saccoglossus kowalevskii TaxID=10224 RepID=A0ABM0GPM4_SACKO|nr:PREDICTED: uncharacterized protein LOC100367977 [Saccoglossus kowalevskii]
MNSLCCIASIICLVFIARHTDAMPSYLYSMMNNCKYNWDCNYGETCIGMVCEPTMKLHSCTNDETCRPYDKTCVNWYCRDVNNSYRNYMPAKKAGPGPWSKYLISRLSKNKQRN